MTSRVLCCLANETGASGTGGKCAIPRTRSDVAVSRDLRHDRGEAHQAERMTQSRSGHAVFLHVTTRPPRVAVRT